MEREQLLARAGEGAAWQMDVDAEAQALGYVANSQRALEEAFQTGTAVLSSLAGQRETLKARLACDSAAQQVRWRHGFFHVQGSITLQCSRVARAPAMVAAEQHCRKAELSAPATLQ